MDFVVISDSHIAPDRPCDRYWSKLGEYVVKNKPKYIVHLGDVACLDSLAHFTSLRGDYSTDEELACVAKHLRAFEDKIRREQKKNRTDKKKIYRPIKILCLGNHDIRKDCTEIERIFKEWGWIVVPYLEPINIDGITFCHCMPRRNSDQMCTTAEELLQTWHSNIVVGHSHVQDYAESYNVGTGKAIRAIKCPCFTSFPPQYTGFGYLTWPLGWLEISLNPFEFTWRNIECLWK
jgi:predicted phosphodiesterase